MSIFENYGVVLLLQHEGGRQLASALAGSVRASLPRLAKRLAGLLHRAPTASSP